MPGSCQGGLISKSADLQCVCRIFPGFSSRLVRLDVLNFLRKVLARTVHGAPQLAEARDAKHGRMYATCAVIPAFQQLQALYFDICLCSQHSQVTKLPQKSFGNLKLNRQV